MDVRELSAMDVSFQSEDSPNNDQISLLPKTPLPMIREVTSIVNFNTEKHINLEHGRQIHPEPPLYTCEQMLLNTLDRTTVGDPYQFQFGGFGCTLKCDSQPIMIETPWCKIPFGVSVHKLGNGVTKYSVTMNIELQDKISQVFEKYLGGLDRFLCGIALSRKEEWFGNVPENVITHNFNKSLRTPKPKDIGRYPNTIKLKLPQRDGIFEVMLFKEGDKTPQTLTIHDVVKNLPKFREIRCIITVLPVWVVGNNWGVSFKPIQMEIRDNGFHPMPQTNMFHPTTLNMPKLPVLSEDCGEH